MNPLDVATGARVRDFGTAPDGGVVRLVTLTGGGNSASVMTWGASLQDMRIARHAPSLVLGSPDFAPYLGVMRHFGAIAGPVANRIAGGRAPLAGKVVKLERNEAGRTALHGGSSGTGVSNWHLEDVDAGSCTLSFRSRDGAGGRPGNLDLIARYALGDDGALELEIEGRTDAPTFCNPAHHSYWTLGPVLGDHQMRVMADRYLPTDAAKIPLGPPAGVGGTRFDFRTPRAVMAAGDAPLDHNFCLDAADALRTVCLLTAGDLRLDLATDAPGLQVYDGSGLDTGTAKTHSGTPYGAHAGLALEPQCWPDAPNNPNYPQITLRPGAVYRQRSRFHVTRIDRGTSLPV